MKNKNCCEFTINSDGTFGYYCLQFGTINCKHNLEEIGFCPYYKRSKERCTSPEAHRELERNYRKLLERKKQLHHLAK